ncbi:MAG: holo-ACP synthase [Chloroflexi bacterium]|nr:holo-ACP synthase [Chloroflexota bacterium]
MSTIGVDIEQVARIERLMTRRPLALARLFTPAERAYCEEKAHRAAHYTARFCAKEALAKALRLPPRWLEMEVVRGTVGPPIMHVAGRVAELVADRTIHLSLSHLGDYAVAMVLLEP